MIIIKKVGCLLLIVSPFITIGQNKKPLDHSVYDSWQSLGEKIISNNGNYVAYAINPQEGDGKLVIQKSTGEPVTEVSRGYNATISSDNNTVIFKIKPWYNDTHQAKIQKKKPEDLPKDSLGVYSLKTGKLEKYARVRSYEVPEKGRNLLAIRFETPLPVKKKNSSDTTSVTSTSPTKVVTPANVPTATPVDEPKKTEEGKDEGGDLILKNLGTGEEKTFKSVLEYTLNKTGQQLEF